MQKAYSYFCYPYEYTNPQVYLEYNTKKLNLNEAEAKALQQIEYRNKKTELKKLKQKEYIRKYNKSALIYEEERRMKNREEQMLKKKEQDEQILRIQNYNKTVYQNNMKPFLKEKAQTINRQNMDKRRKKVWIADPQADSKILFAFQGGIRQTISIHFQAFASWFSKAKGEEGMVLLCWQNR